MGIYLHALRYSDLAYSGSAHPSESFIDIKDVAIRWALPGGLQRIELTVRANSKGDAIERYLNHLGHRIQLYDSFHDKPLGGHCYEILKDGRYVTYICAGPWRRMNDSRYSVSDRITSTSDTDDVIKDILTDVVTIDNTDQSNIDGSNVSADGWAAADSRKIFDSKLAGNAIEELARVGDNTDNPMDFYFVDERFSGGGNLAKPIPYLKSRSSTASPDWQFGSADEVNGTGNSLGRNLWNLATTLQIAYNYYSGAATSTGVSLVDSGAQFFDMVSPGDRVYNITTQTAWDVQTVNNDTTLTMTDSGASFTTSDLYTIHLQHPQITAAAAPDEDYWTAEALLHFPEMDQVMAAQIRDKVVAIYSQPVQQQAFVLASKYIRDGSGALWPLWRPLFKDSFYFRKDDLYSEYEPFNSSDDRKQTFMAIAMDYTYRDNKLRIVPSTNDSRLDAILAKAGLISGQLANTVTYIEEGGWGSGWSSRGYLDPGTAGGPADVVWWKYGDSGGVVVVGDGPTSYPDPIENTGGGVVVIGGGPDPGG